MQRFKLQNSTNMDIRSVKRYNVKTKREKIIKNAKGVKRYNVKTQGEKIIKNEKGRISSLYLMKAKIVSFFILSKIHYCLTNIFSSYRIKICY